MSPQLHRYTCHQESEHLLGRSDVVLRHIRFSEAASWHAATRAFYGRALGTADYGFVTVLRHPVDRWGRGEQG